MTPQEIYKRAFAELNTLYPEQEIRSMVRIMLNFVTGISYSRFLAEPDTKVSNSELTRIQEIIFRLSKEEPLQYILGETEFFGLRFLVNRSVLIPRPETEELVDWIVKDMKADPVNENKRVLDIGTGTGCIIISVARFISDCSATAIDLSSDAIILAEENARLNNVAVDFHKHDILESAATKKFAEDKFHIIISNPPYVRESEKTHMHPNVLNYEPASALFVPDDNPLIYYSAIGDFASSNLKQGGTLYLEINENLAAETKVLLRSGGFENIELRKDIHGKNRMIKCKKSF